MGRIASTATINRITAPRRSTQGARLKNSHYTTMRTAQSIPPSTAIIPIGISKTSASPAIGGMTYLASTSTIARTTPGHSRSGFRDVPPSVDVDMSVDTT